MARIRFLREAYPERPAFEAAVSAALLRRASEGSAGDSLRLFRPGQAVTFGRKDVLSAGYPAAIRAAREAGFEAVERLAGGRAALYYEGTLGFAWTLSDPEARTNIDARFEEITNLLIRALRCLGIDAQLGPVAGEYCPGSHSVNARGAKKLVGVGQRVVSKAAHVGGVIVIADASRIREILVPVYAALGIEWAPESSGSLEEEVGPLDPGQVEAAILAEFSERHELIESSLDPETLSLAARLEPEHRSPLRAR